jgi:hypothetical protein
MDPNLIRGIFDPYPHLPLICELDRIVDQVHEDLKDPSLIVPQGHFGSLLLPLLSFLFPYSL